MYYIIVNPASRSGKGAKLWADVEPVIKAKKIPYKVFFSQKAGHICQLVREISDSVLGSDPAQLLKLIVLGGDGTINEALQGITDFSRTQIGYLPTGSSNDLARDLKPGNTPSEILDRIFACKCPFLMDIGQLTYLDTDGCMKMRYYIGSCGIGYDAAVCKEVSVSKFKNFFNRIGLGKLTYLVIALKQLLATKKAGCTFTLDNGQTITLPRFLFMAFMQHKYEGGGFMFCPDADCQDGLLDFCLAGDIPKWKVLIILPFALKGRHYRFKEVYGYRSSSLTLDASVPLFIHTDGEAIARTDHLTVTCLKQKLQFLY